MNDRRTVQELQDEIDAVRAQFRLYAGSKWRHNKAGTMYTVNVLAFNEVNMVVSVIYCPFVGGEESFRANSVINFIRPASEFLERFTLVSI